MTKEIEEKMKEQPKRVTAVIREYYGGQYGRMGEYIAIIEPEYFKNGKFKKQTFRVIEIVERTKRGYGCGPCRRSETIHDILDVIDN